MKSTLHSNPPNKPKASLLTPCSLLGHICFNSSTPQKFHYHIFDIQNKPPSLGVSLFEILKYSQNQTTMKNRYFSKFDLYPFTNGCQCPKRKIKRRNMSFLKGVIFFSKFLQPKTSGIINQIRTFRIYVLSSVI